MTLEDYTTNIALGFAEITDITNERVYNSGSIIFDVRAITKFKRIPLDYLKIPWASKVDNRATGLQVFTFKSKEELFLHNYSSDGYVKGYSVSVGLLTKIENDLIDECFIKSCLLVNELTDDYTLRISRKAERIRRVYNAGVYSNSSNIHIEIMALKLEEEYEFLPITSRLKTK